MAVTVTTTIGGESSNSYVSLATAQTYMDARLNADAWDDAATDDIRNRALVMAARRLNDESYVGQPVYVDPRQALAWPRHGAYDRDGVWLDSDAIPQVVKDAQCELALALLVADTDDLLADTGLEGFSAVTVGPISVTPIQGRNAGKVPAHVRRILDPVLSAPGGSIRLVRG